MNKLLKNPRNLAFLGIMLALTILLDSTPLGAIPIGTVSATIVQIPTIITGVILGPIAGLIMGTSFGIISLIHAATRPVTLLDPLFVNPLISVLPRMTIGVVAYYAYALVSSINKKNNLVRSISLIIAGAMGSLSNTAFVFLMLYLVFKDTVVEKVSDFAPNFGAFALMVFSMNAIPEAIVSAILVFIIASAYFQYSRVRSKS